MNDVSSPSHAEYFDEADAEDLVRGDLSRSGLEPQDIRASIMGPTERLMCGVDGHVLGYTIPYFDLGGKPLGFYRVRLFDQNIKYKQLKDTPNQVYFPRNFLPVFRGQPNRPPFIVLTEGEKKAAIACKFGIPCVAFGGVDSWRNRMLLIPKATEIKAYRYNKDLLTAKLPSGTEGYSSEYAKGFEDLCNFGLRYGVTMIIIYDSDHLVGVKPDVQRAAAALGHELRHRGYGILQIRQLVLPSLAETDSVSLDDYLTADGGGPAKLKGLIKDVMAKRTAFPRHPNPAEFIEKKLASPKLTRRDMNNLTLSVLTELDAAGRRMYSPENRAIYYFDNATAKLMPVILNVMNKESIHSTEFGRLLYRNYGIVPAADNRFIQFLGAQYVAEEPLETVSPHKVFARPGPNEDVIRYQISSGQYIRVLPNHKQPFEILDNGSDNILFEAQSGDDLDAQELAAELIRQRELRVENWWADTLSKVRLRDQDKARQLTALLYYASPWLYRWRDTQLPVEIIIGEAGSGKSTLCELRLNIILGGSTLRNAPTDLKDWHASIVNTGGIHVTDNVQFGDKNLRQRLSDEICRLITEPDPHIEMRKFYTEADLVRLKIDPIFVFTSIGKPFHQSDLLQRSIILELDKSSGDDEIQYDASWKSERIRERGGRVAWVAHHLTVLHEFLRAVQSVWNPNYQAKHRLINLEQILVVLARDVFKQPHSWIPDYLSSTVAASVVNSDDAMMGLNEFVDEFLAGGAENSFTTAGQIVEWAEAGGGYTENYILTNARSLGRYLVANRHAVATIAGLIEDQHKMANRMRYKIVRTARHKAGQQTE